MTLTDRRFRAAGCAAVFDRLGRLPVFGDADLA